MTDNIIRAIRATVELDDYSFDAYELPDGEKRVGYAGISTVFGYERNWLGRLHAGDSRQLKAMIAAGYSMLHKEVEIFQSGSKSANTYGTRANTVSIRDFTKIAVYEGLKKKNERGIVILAAMAEYGIEQTIELAFTGKSLDRILSKIKHYTTWTHDELMQVLTENREDVAKLRLGLFY